MSTALQCPEADSAGVLVGRKSSTPKKPEPSRSGSESRRHGTLVRLGGELVEVAREVAALRKMSMAEYLTSRFLPIVKADHEAEIMKRVPKK